MAILDTFFDSVIEKDNSVTPPIAVLKELAYELERSTTGLLIGEIKQDFLSLKFRLQFSIRAPSLNNYSYHVFTIRHNLDFYPLRIEPADRDIFKVPSDATSSENADHRYIDAKDQEELEDSLKIIFSSPQVKKVINGLLMQIKSAN